MHQSGIVCLHEAIVNAISSLSGSVLKEYKVRDKNHKFPIPKEAVTYNLCDVELFDVDF